MNEGQYVEYQVVGMSGSPAVSGVYTSVNLGRAEALQKATACQRARGGRILRRTIDVSPWHEVNKEAYE